MEKTASKRMVGILAAFLLVAFTAGVACAGPPAPPVVVGGDSPIDRWKSTGSCYGCDLSNLTLPVPSAFGPDKVNGQTKTLEGATCQNTVFSEGIDLTGYNLKNAKFPNATFNGTNLNNAKVTAAVFQKTKFFKDSKGKQSDLSGITSDTVQVVDFLDADLSDAKKPDTWPGSASLRRALHSKTIKCDDDDTKGYCKSITACKDFANKHRVKADNSCSAL